MIQVIKKWKVSYMRNQVICATFFISDNHIQNVLTILNKIDFPDSDGVEVVEVKTPESQSITGFGVAGLENRGNPRGI